MEIGIDCECQGDEGCSCQDGEDAFFGHLVSMFRGSDESWWGRARFGGLAQYLPLEVSCVQKALIVGRDDVAVERLR